VEVLASRISCYLHACSTYPVLRRIESAGDRRAARSLWRAVGYSGHETGFAFKRRGGGDGSLHRRAAHYTRSLHVGFRTTPHRSNPNGITRLVRDIRLIEKSKGDGVKRGAGTRATDHQKASARGSGIVRRKKPDKAPAIVARIKASPWMSRRAHRRRRLVGPNGEEWKRFHFADIMGLSLARNRAWCSR